MLWGWIKTKYLEVNQLEQVAHRILNFCGKLTCPAPKGSENGHHLQDARVGKGGSNPNVICILLILPIDILRALS